MEAGDLLATIIVEHVALEKTRSNREQGSEWGTRPVETIAPSNHPVVFHQTVEHIDF
jgi:hypothetical protein